ncbi:hypothetical protein ACKX2D_11680 [Lachnospiraceae bacterium YH-ros2226]
MMERRINKSKLPYSADKVNKRNKVRKKIYVILIMLSIIIIVGTLLLQKVTKNNDIKLVLEVFTNLAYGIFGSTLVALLIEIRDVRIQNRDFIRTYVLTIKSFLYSYIYLMTLFRKCVVKHDKNVEYRNYQWVEWAEKAIENQDKFSEEDCANLKEAIEAVRKDINLIFQAGSSGVLKALDEVSYNRLSKIDKDLELLLDSQDSSIIVENLKYKIVEECNSWFLLKGLDKESFGAQIDFVCESVRSRIFDLFKIDI